MVRDINEDAWRFVEDAGDALAIVTDGMGSSSSGRPAADLTVAICETVFARRLADYAEAWWRAEHAPPAIAWAQLADADRAVVEARVREIRSTRVPATPGDLAILDAEGDLLAAVARRGLTDANRAVANRSSDDVLWRGMGATAVAAVFGGSAVGIANVGDARCYLLRAGSLQQLTTDHTLLAAMLAQGTLSPAEIETFPHKGVITRAIGFAETEVDARSLELEPGDVFLLCTDGISNTIDERSLREVLERGCEAATLLVEEGRRTSRDNVTALVVEVFR